MVTFGCSKMLNILSHYGNWKYMSPIVTYNGQICSLPGQFSIQHYSLIGTMNPTLRSSKKTKLVKNIQILPFRQPKNFFAHFGSKWPTLGFCLLFPTTHSMFAVTFLLPFPLKALCRVPFLISLGHQKVFITFHLGHTYCM